MSVEKSFINVSGTIMFQCLWTGRFFFLILAAILKDDHADNLRIKFVSIRYSIELAD